MAISLAVATQCPAKKREANANKMNGMQKLVWIVSMCVIFPFELVIAHITIGKKQAFSANKSLDGDFKLTSRSVQIGACYALLENYFWTSSLKVFISGPWHDDFVWGMLKRTRKRSLLK